MAHFSANLWLGRLKMRRHLAALHSRLSSPSSQFPTPPLFFGTSTDSTQKWNYYFLFLFPSFLSGGQLNPTVSSSQLERAMTKWPYSLRCPAAMPHFLVQISCSPIHSHLMPADLPVSGTFHPISPKRPFYQTYSVLSRKL